MALTSKPQHPATLKVKGNHLGTTYSTVETPPMMDLLATHEATSLAVKATHKNSDISAFNTPTETDLLVTQGLKPLGVNATHPNSNISTITTTATTDLPPEVWMVVFEQIHSEEDYARPEFVAKYADSLSIHGDSLEAARTLPDFEQRSWLKTRPLYAINRNSRAAALKLQLCLHILRSFRKPVAASEYFGLLIVFSRVSSPLYSMPVPAPVSPHIVIQFPAQQDPSINFDNFVAIGLARQYMYAGMQWLKWHPERRVILLPDLASTGDAQLAFQWPRKLRYIILEIWLRNGIRNGTVEILS
jgi:hypothetical protein